MIRQIVVASGVVTTLAGTAGMSGAADGTGAAARFLFPHGITADGKGNLFVADTLNHTVRQIVLATGAVSTVAGVAGLASVELRRAAGRAQRAERHHLRRRRALYITTAHENGILVIESRQPSPYGSAPIGRLLADSPSARRSR